METCVMLFWSMHFCKLHSISPINVCTNFEINRYKIDKLYRQMTNLENMQKSYRMFQPPRSLYDFRFQSYDSNSGFNVFDDLDLDHWPMFYWLSHKVGISLWSFIRIHHVLMGDMATVKVLKNALCFIIGYLVAMEIRVTLFWLVHFLAWYIVYVQSICIPILRSIGTKWTNLQNMQKSCFIWRHVTQKQYVVHQGG